MRRDLGEDDGHDADECDEGEKQERSGKNVHTRSLPRDRGHRGRDSRRKRFAVSAPTLSSVVDVPQDLFPVVLHPRFCNRLPLHILGLIGTTAL
jgi:hypothetical protein